ncbi:MAG TPA: methyltransferase domain-containing protein [Solirubrobacteraceae bacterium]|jgi:trans-aconitate 2-methyltransferase|nr:methyltransferase domain-containing protein [Solirubrobacteraceae bacterium]
MPVREWDGKSYDRVSGTMEALGLAVLERLELNGDELVLDAGCGSGRITEALLERLPQGRVIAVDESPSMVEAARTRLGPDADVRVMDLLQLELEQPLDAILSTATFHWISDHQRLFRSLHGALKPGGRLVAQCGGEGNITVLRSSASKVLAREPYAQHFLNWQPPWNYAGAESTHERLLAAGFSTAECWLAPAPREPEHPREFLSTIVLGPHVQQLPPELREPFMDDVLAELGEPVVVDYVRLNIDAVAGSSPPASSAA